MRLFCALVFATVCCAGQAVEGTVSNAVNGAGIPGVQITLSRAGKSYKAISDGPGLFRIEDVAEGDYVASFSKQGFVGPIAGMAPDRELRVGGAPLRCDMALLPGARLAGHVTNSEGQPVGHAGIMLSDPGMTVAIVHETAADGSFEFQNLSPGSYLLDAEAPPSMAAPPAVEGEARGWVRTYFPAERTTLTAARITVNAGWDVSGQDIRLLAAPVHRLRGVVLDEGGRPAASASLKLMLNEHMNSKEVVFRASEKGLFESPLLPDGAWRLSASVEGRGGRLRAFRPVEVRGREVEGLELHVTPPFAVPLSVEPRESAVQTGCVVFSPVEGGAGDEIVQGCSEGKEFTVPNLYARQYIVNALASGGGYYLASITQGERDLMGMPVELHPGALPIRVVYKKGGGTIGGTVENCREALVIAMPQEAGLRSNESYRLVRNTTCDTDGRFRISNIRPGRYFLFAFDRLAWGHNEFAVLDRDLLNRAVSANVLDGEAEAVELKVTRRAQ